MAIANNLKLSAEQYLEGELLAEQKHELIDGEAWALAGASKNHNRIVVNLTIELGTQLKGKSCEPFAAAMKIHADGDYYYPDLSVVCEKDKRDTDYVTHSPSVIIEVLSKTTRNLDHGIKRKRYQSIPSLHYYLLVEQDFCEITLFSREAGWVPEYFYLGDSIELPAINVVLNVVDIYERIENEDITAWLKKQSDAQE